MNNTNKLFILLFAISAITTTQYISGMKSDQTFDWEIITANTQAASSLCAINTTEQLKKKPLTKMAPQKASLATTIANSWAQIGPENPALKFIQSRSARAEKIARDKRHKNPNSPNKTRVAQQTDKIEESSNCQKESSEKTPAEVKESWEQIDNNNLAFAYLQNRSNRAKKISRDKKYKE